MNLIDHINAIQASLAALEAAFAALDVSPQLEEIDTRIKVLAGKVTAQVTPSEPAA
jgi:hypothetical protein